MIDKIKSLLGGGHQVDLASLVQQGAVILDVRTPAEYAGGHIPGSLNIPVDTLAGSLGKLKDKSKPIITCCASGMRSAAAANLLKAQGYAEVYNGGGWSSLRAKIGK